MVLADCKSHNREGERPTDTHRRERGRGQQTHTGESERPTDTHRGERDAMTNTPNMAEQGWKRHTSTSWVRQG